ncbi:hypothetical protein BD410DRAFT_885818 [Rickenella mellea]|uniref:DUF6535 domain-containing protein n=1 Tax=Rickenella mellea TaxID=50990 RepID=A0A4Y7PRW2_9AGAM|nr:hypothetical protein BD410DRAFT_885818 [Rickenella mellea]
MQWWKMEVIVEMIPALLHISLLLFFIGLLLFLHIINDAVALCTFCFCATGTAVYTWLTIAPLIFPGCPYKTPFSGLLRLSLKPSLRVAWKLSAVSLACIIVWLSIALSAFIQLWSPSFKVTPPKRAQGLYSPFGRFLRSLADHKYHLRHRDSYLPQILLRSWQNIRAFAKHVYSTASWITRTALDVFAERRRIFCNELTTHDTRALGWVMDYSNRDIDLFTIITAVPDFVQSNASLSGVNNVQSVMWNCGVIPHTIQRLRSTSFSKNRAKPCHWSFVLGNHNLVDTMFD